MSVATLAARAASKQFRMPFVSDLRGATSQAQADAVPLTSTVHVVSGGAASSFILPRIASGESDSNIVLVLNESAVTIQVFPAAGESVNGALNTALALTTGQVGVFLCVQNVQEPNATNSGPNWKSAAIAL